MTGISADKLRVLLDADNVMETVLSFLTHRLHGWFTNQKLKNSPDDHIGLFKHGTLHGVSYKDLLFRVNDLRCGTDQEREVYKKYMGHAERTYLLFGVDVRNVFPGLHWFDYLQLRKELTDYFISSKKKSGRNEEAHRFSTALKSAYVVYGSHLGPQYVLQDTPSKEATRNPALREEILGRLEELLDFDELPPSVKQPLLTCKNVFELQVRYLKRIFGGGALRRTDQGTYRRESANSTRW